MKILAISVYYKPIRPGYGTRTPEIIIDSAARMGHDVILYTGVVPDDMISEQKFGERRTYQTIGKGSVEINRLWIPRSGHHKPYRRSMIYTLFIISCFFRMAVARNFDVIMGISPFPPFFIPLEILAKLRRRKFYMHQGDLFPNTVIDFNLTKSRVMIRLLQTTSIMSFKLADIIGVNNLATKQGMAQYPIDQDKVIFIELAIDIQIFKIVSVDRDDKFVILYNGVFGPAYDFDIILDAAQVLSKFNDIKFMIAGKGELKSYIEDGIRKRSLNNVILQEPVARTSDLIERLNSCDVAVVCLVSADVSKTPHPSKIFEYMACGRPVVCSGSGALEDLFNRSKAGFIVPPGDVGAFVDAILRLYRDSNLRHEMGTNGRRFVEEHHSMEVYMRNLEVIITKLRK